MELWTSDDQEQMDEGYADWLAVRTSAFSSADDAINRNYERSQCPEVTGEYPELASAADIAEALGRTLMENDRLKQRDTDWREYCRRLEITVIALATCAIAVAVLRWWK